MSVNHVIFGTQTLIDLRSDTVAADKILTGYTAHGADGEAITGSMPNRGSVSGTISTVNGSYSIAQGYHNGNGAVTIDSAERAKIIAANIKAGVSILGVTGTHEGESGTDTSDATAAANEILSGKTAYVNGQKLTGSMSNRGAVSGSISDISDSYSIAEGYHNGNGAVSIDSTEAAKLIASNIRAGVSILGVLGTLGLFTQVTPIATDFNNGYVGNINGWIYQANSNNRGNVYQVTAGHTYFCRLVGTGGNRWRGCFTTGNPVTATGNLSGSCVIYHNENTVPEKACFAYKPRVDGYITIVKSNAGVNNIQTIMYDITGFDMLLGA